jgi:hypothetical protein
MNAIINDIVRRNVVFAWIALATCLALLVPLLAMQFTAAVDWGILDCVVMGALVFGTGSLFVLVARKVPYKYWLAVGVVLTGAFLYVWAELAVGIFTNLGS